MKTPDYFSAKEAVQRLEAVIGKAVIRPAEDEGPLRPAGEHVIDLGPTVRFARPSPAATPPEAMGDYVARRKAELTEQMEELEFLTAVEALQRRFPRFFGR